MTPDLIIDWALALMLATLTAAIVLLFLASVAGIIAALLSD